jgi:hypothetical protein
MLTDHGSFVLLNIYAPNAGEKPLKPRLEFKMRFLNALRSKCKKHQVTTQSPLLSYALKFFMEAVSTSFKSLTGSRPEAASRSSSCLLSYVSCLRTLMWPSLACSCVTFAQSSASLTGKSISPTRKAYSHPAIIRPCSSLCPQYNAGKGWVCSIFLAGDELVASGRHVIVVGDLNVSHREADIHSCFGLHKVYAPGTLPSSFLSIRSYGFLLWPLSVSRVFSFPVMSIFPGPGLPGTSRSRSR